MQHPHPHPTPTPDMRGIKPYPGKTPAGIRRAAKCLARKSIARYQRSVRKELTAKTFPFAGVLGVNYPKLWHMLMATALSRPIIGYPWERPVVMAIPIWLHPNIVPHRPMTTGGAK